MKPLMQQGDEALVRELLKQALGDLDTIAAEPAPYEDAETLIHLYRQVAERGARHIRARLRAAQQ